MTGGWLRRVLLIAVAAALVPIPYGGRPPSPDEGGLLLLASQWSPGTSLYGDYFVDRPPGLVALVALADGAGGIWALRLLGALAVGLTVLLSGVVGRLAAPDRAVAPVLTATTAALLTVTPLFGGTVVDGELLGLPFLVAGVAAALRATTATRSASVGWGLVAGCAGAAGALVKQSLLDVFVAAAVLALVSRRPRPLAGVAVGAVGTVALAVWAASLRGTDPVALWDAVVVFRREAAAVIATEATSSTPQRMLGMLGALALSGAPILAAVLGRSLLRRARPGVPDLRWPALAVLAWELAVVLLGGSYWLHYLLGLVPGLVLLTAAAAQRPLPGRRALAAAYGLVAAVTAGALVWIAVVDLESTEEPALAYLQAHAARGDTAVVAFGAPNILQEAGLTSPYPDLWSLPVRVHDPDLVHLTALLRSDDRPTWVVVAGRSLDSWGIDGSVADGVLAVHYDRAATTGYWTIYRADPAVGGAR